jgi:hypothetical protein
MFKVFLTGINIKRLIYATLAVFGFIFLSDWLIHGPILGNCYKETKELWRSEEDMQNFFIFLLIGQLIIAKYFTYFFAKGYQAKGIMEGVRFGLIMGFFSCGALFIQYATTPITSGIFWSWIGATIIQSILAGIVASLVYKK